MTRAVSSGWAQGMPIRRARKGGRCEYWMGLAGQCEERIEPGDEYVEGEMNIGKAGGFGRDRWCLAHFAPEEVSGEE